MGGNIIYIDDFISRLDGVKRGRGSQYTAKCPAHDDRHSSLSVSQSTDGKILLNCFAGCTAEQIVSSLGLKLSDLFSEQSKPQLNTQFTNRPSGGKAIVYDYTDDMGNVIVKKF